MKGRGASAKEMGISRSAVYRLKAELINHVEAFGSILKISDLNAGTDMDLKQAIMG